MYYYILAKINSEIFTNLPNGEDWAESVDSGTVTPQNLQLIQ